MNRIRTTLLLAAGGLTVAVLSPLTGGAATPSAAPAPVIASSGAGPATAPAASTFERPITNPYFPLVPGTVAVLRGSEDGRHFRERVVVTHRTRMIQGVRTRVVSDVVRRRDGSLAEKTRDWYATDEDGRVWYFGEATATYDRRGHLVDREGSWQAGVDGAVAGTIMPARPRAADAFRQELRRGEAEDQAWVVQHRAVVTTPAGRFDRAVRTFEWSRLEPGVISTKFYAPGLGLVLERDVAGGNEVFRLVSLHRP